MTPERAQYIIDNAIYGSFRYAFMRCCDTPLIKVPEDGITLQEDAYIHKLLKTMPSNTSYSDAVYRIAHGLPVRPVFGFSSFSIVTRYKAVISERRSAVGAVAILLALIVLTVASLVD